MANSIALVTKYQPLLDEVYASETLTQDWEHGKVKFDGSNTVKILKLQVPPLGAYSRNSGFTKADAVATWESWTLAQDRGTEFSVDAMDNEETLDQAFLGLASEFIRVSVVPQVDTYRFSTVSSLTGISTASATLSTGASVISALRTAITAMDEDKVPKKNRVLYITPTLKGLIDDLDTTKSKKVLETFAKVVEVPQDMFYTNAEYDATTEEIQKSDDSLDLNFLIVYLPAIEAVAKHKKLRIFLADGDDGTGANKNQDGDSNKMQYRLYHDVFVYENKVAGIYAHTAPAQS